MVGEAIASAVDVSVEKETAEMAREVTGRWGKIDLLVNNAALVRRYQKKIRQRFDKITEEDWDKMMAVNVKGAWLCAKAVYPQMKKQNYGKIVNMASGTYFAGAPLFVHYGASKGAIVSLTRSLSRELGPDNISVNVIAPSLTQTEMTEEIDPAYAEEFAQARCFQRKQYPEDLTDALLFFCLRAQRLYHRPDSQRGRRDQLSLIITLRDLLADKSDRLSLEGGGHLGDKAVELLEVPGGQ